MFGYGYPGGYGCSYGGGEWIWIVLIIFIIFFIFCNNRHDGYNQPSRCC